MEKAPTGPLDAQELECLQGRLVGAMPQSGCMPLDVAHGFLSATVGAAPAGSGEAGLLDRVLGGLAADIALRGLLARFRSQLRAELQDGEYGPLILEMPCADGSTLPLPYGWCQGYVAGLEYLGEARRDRLIGDQQAGTLLAPILSFLMYEEAQLFDPPNEAAHRETAAELGAAAVGLFRWWQRRPAD